MIANVMDSPVQTVELRSPTEEFTWQAGAELGRVLQAGTRVGLRGPLGAGKTTFVRGIAAGLGVSADKVRSPTFTLINEYSGGRLPLYHVDFYRLSPTAEDLMCLREVLYGEGVTVAEWWDRIKGESCHVEVEFQIAGACERVLRCALFDPRYSSWVACLEKWRQQWR